MAARDLVVNIDGDVLDSADAIFEEIGLDTPTAVRIFLKRVIKEGRIPFELVAGRPAQENTYHPSIPAAPANTVPDRRAVRPVGKITRDMCLSIWNEFKRRYSSGDRRLQEASQIIGDTTGMNKGSAFIYLTIINNLVDGLQNTRTLKFDDLVFFAGKITDELPESAHKSMIRSLEASIPYWEEKVPGAFADKVRRLVEKLRSL